MTTAERIKILRVLNGHSQQSLADVVGVSRASITSWEKDKVPAPASAKVLSYHLGVSKAYLLQGLNPPLAASWKIVPPAHPKHLPAMACDLSNSLPALFGELGIDFVVEGASTTGICFMLCGNSPACDNWSMNYVISYEESARTLVQGAVQRTSASLMEWQSSGFYERPEAFVVDTSECLASIHGRPVDCRPLLAKFGESVEDATLAGLLKRLDGMLQSQKAAFGENEVGILSTFIGKEIVKRTRSEGAGLVAR